MKVNFEFDLDNANKAKWEKFWHSCSHSHLRQHILAAEIERQKGRIPVYAAGFEDGRLVSIGIFTIRPLLFANKFSFEAVCLRGPAFDEAEHGKEFLLQLISQFKTLNVGSIRVSPYWIFPDAQVVENALNDLGFKPYYKCQGSRSFTGLVDLQPDKNKILASFSQSTRYQIRLADRCEVSIRPAANIDEAKLAFQCLSSMRSQRGLTPMSFNEFSSTFEYVLKDKRYGICLNSYNDSKFLGGLWITRGPFIANPSGYAVLPNISKSLSSSLTIGPVLWFEAMKWAKQAGCKLLDVEGFRDDADKSHPKYYLWEHKKRFRPLPAQVLAEHIYVCNPLTFAASKACGLFNKSVRLTKSLQSHFSNRKLVSRK